MPRAHRHQKHGKSAPPPPQQQAMEMQQLHHQRQYRQPAPPPPHLQQQQQQYPPPPQQHMGTWPGQGYQYPPPQWQQYPQGHPGAAGVGAYPYPPPPQSYPPPPPQANYLNPAHQGRAAPYMQHGTALQGQQQNRRTSGPGNQRPPQHQVSDPTIRQQPTHQQRPSGKVDRHGERILAEGTPSRSSLACDGVSFYLLMAFLLGVGGLVLFFIIIPIGICCGLKASKSWRLYFTRSGIYHVRTTGSGCSCCYSTLFFPLSDIKNITYIVGQKSILIQFVDPAKVNDYIHWCNRPLCRKLTGIIIEHVANSEEFVLAVRQHMGLR